MMTLQAEVPPRVQFVAQPLTKNRCISTKRYLTTLEIDWYSANPALRAFIQLVKSGYAGVK